MININANTTVEEVINAFGSFGRLLFPYDRLQSFDMTLAEVSSSNVFIWYSNVLLSETIEVLQNLYHRVDSGEQVFYSIYTAEEIKKDFSKADTGLFYFKGKPGKPFAIMNAGGGFVYVGAMHDSFPQALEVSKKGYNAFALIYRPDYAYDDLAQAISFIMEHAQELEVETEGYSLWGGSAGARMAAIIGNATVLKTFHLKNIPSAVTVVTQYTGYSSIDSTDAPTYACVGTSDYIADWRIMKRRLERLRDYGIDTEFHVFDDLNHGFGLGTGTIAEGWIDDAIAFWQRQIHKYQGRQK